MEIQVTELQKIVEWIGRVDKKQEVKKEDVVELKRLVTEVASAHNGMAKQINKLTNDKNEAVKLFQQLESSVDQRIATIRDELFEKIQKSIQGINKIEQVQNAITNLDSRIQAASIKWEQFKEESDLHINAQLKEVTTNRGQIINDIIRNMNEPIEKRVSFLVQQHLKDKPPKTIKACKASKKTA